MKFISYLKDKILELIIFSIMFFLLIMMFFAFKIDISLIVVTVIIIFFSFALVFIYSFYRKKTFYDTFLSNLENLDQKYLITETVSKPNFLEGKILHDSLYEIDKSMKEKINNYKDTLDDFEDYIEMWIHEVKIPLANLILINHNSGGNEKIKRETVKLENYVEQILYYARSENAEKDYLIKKYDLKEIINKVVLKNKDSFIFNKVTLKISDFSCMVLTDCKWLEFIINQIINNSLKYSKESLKLEIDAKKENNSIVLSIKDNGIGIKKSDIYKVFDKSFTGYNGRERSVSTGMGLYICKKLCDKLGHKIKIESKENKYTIVTIVFEENEFYNVLN